MDTRTETPTMGQVRGLVLHTIARHPEEGFTPAALAQRLGLSPAEVRGALLDLARLELVLWSEDEYVSAA
jgi:DNA-binding IclR family transcriptional regulator